jgi:hypothetical protein
LKRLGQFALIVWAEDLEEVVNRFVNYRALSR